MIAPRGDVAVIGAGLSGLTAAERLAAAGLRVHVFDKARGTGGRMSVRREGSLRFDHGAQYFTARTPEFRQAVDAWKASGIVARWETKPVTIGDALVGTVCDSEERFVPVPGMNEIARHLARTLQVFTRNRIVQLQHGPAGWLLTTEEGVHYGPYGALVLAIPAPQAGGLLKEHPLHAAAAAVPMSPCWAVLCAFEPDLPMPWSAAFINRGPLAWAARNSDKPGRGDNGAWVVHASADWSRSHEEADPVWVQKTLLTSFFEVCACAPREPAFVQAHRWRFARAPHPQEKACHWHEESRLGLCGDWCADGRVEGAFLSGLRLAERMLASVKKNAAR